MTRLAARFERTRLGPKGEVTRFYAVSVEPQRQLSIDGSSGFDLIIVRGRLGGRRKPTTKQITFPTLAHAAEKWGVLCARRRSRGYIERTEQ